MKQNITVADFREKVRYAVLGALDACMREAMNHPEAKGWTDAELCTFLPSIDTQAENMAARVWEGFEPGSASVNITE